MFTALPFGPITQGALPFFSSGRGALLTVHIRLPRVGIQSLLCGLGLFASFLALFFVSAACFFSSFARAFAAAAFAFALILASAASFSAGRSPSRSFVPLPILCSDVRLSLLCSLGAWRVRRTKTSFGELVCEPRHGPRRGARPRLLPQRRMRLAQQRPTQDQTASPSLPRSTARKPTGARTRSRRERWLSEH